MRTIIFNDGSTSFPIHNYKHISLDINKNCSIYVGAFTPFNFFYFKGRTYNLDNSLMQVSYWNGKNFQGSYFVYDETEGFKKEGYVDFQIDPKIGWKIVGDTRSVSELQGLPYYDLYWAKINFSEDLTTVGLEFLGDMFCTDEDLYKEFYKFSTDDFKDAWGSSKTNWFDQRVIASNLIVNELKKQKRIISSGQIVKRETLINACVQQVASLIFRNSGGNYANESDNAKRETIERLDHAVSFLDSDKDGVLTQKDSSSLSWER
jgi:hypothetical protein